MGQWYNGSSVKERILGKDLKGKELGVGYIQRLDGRYEARALVRGTRVSLYGKNLKTLRAEFEQAKEDALIRAMVYPADMTFHSWFKEWFDKFKRPSLKESSVAPTLSRYYTIYQPYIGNMKLKDIRNVHIQAAINTAIEKGRAISTVRDVTGLMRACFESARNNQLIRVNPAFEVILPTRSVKQKPRRFLEDWEIKLFLEEIELSYYKEMYYVMLLTGMRVGELGALRWSDIDFEKKETNINSALMVQYNEGNKIVRVTKPKTSNSFRSIPFIGNIEEMYLSWREKQAELKERLGTRWRSLKFGDDFVFTTSLGSLVSRYTVERDLRVVVDSINVGLKDKAIRENTEYTPMEHIYPHALRHTFCSRCFEVGIEPKVVQLLMGHSSYSTTIDIYTHVTKKKMSTEAAKFDLLEVGEEIAPKNIKLDNIDCEHFL